MTGILECLAGEGNGERGFHVQWGDRSSKYLMENEFGLVSAVVVKVEIVSF